MSDSTSPGEHPAVPPQAPPYSPPPAQDQGQHYSAVQPAQAPQTYPAPPQYPGAQQQSPQYPGAQPYQQPYAAAQPYPAPGYAPARPTSGLAVTSLITGIAGIVLSWAFVPLLASVVAVITGHMALKQTRANPALGGRGMAIAGLILGYVGVAFLALAILFGILSLFAIGTAGFLPFLLTS